MPTISSASVIAGLLAERVEDLATALRGTPPTSRTRDEARYGRRGSFSVVLRGDRRGRFFDHEAGTGGDALALVCHLRRCAVSDAMRWAAGWLGGELADAPPRPARQPEAKALPERRTIDLARAIWLEAVPAEGTPTEAYLHFRGLHLPPDAPLKFHPSCPRGRESLPAMVALMSDPITGQPTGIHRTYLRPDGQGKADGQKMMLGNGGVVRLVEDDEVTTGLGICEGVETGLALMQRAGWRPIWAAGSAGAISTFPVLPGIEALTIFADADPAGERAARACAERWAAAGREASIWTPAASGSDWDDAWRGAA